MSTIKSSTEHLTLNADGSGKEIKFQANGTEKAKITSTGVDVSGNVDINNSVPILKLTDTDDSSYSRVYNSAGGLYLDADKGDGVSGSVIQFGVDDVARMLIDSSGNVLINSADANASTTGIKLKADNRIFVTKDSNECISLNRIGSDGTVVEIRNDGSTVGTIAVSGSSTSYNTSSDYRLKENVEPMTGSIDRLNQLNPSRFNFIADVDTTVDGFLAHEAQEVVPEAITGEKDAMRTEEYEVTPAQYETITIPAVEEELDEDGNVVVEAQEERTEEQLVTEAVMGEREVEDYQGIDQSKLVPLLVGALQEAVARIEQLENA